MKSITKGNFELEQILQNAGYETISGGDAVLNAIASVSDGSTDRLCSGWGVFPNGDKCPGCSDCAEICV